MAQARGDGPRMWRSVAERLLLIALVGWLVVLWFQGCLAPSAREEIRQDQQKNAPPSTPVPSP